MMEYIHDPVEFFTKKETKEKVNLATQTFNKLVEGCVRKGWACACLYQSVLLKELFAKNGIESKVIQGWMKMSGMFQIWHCWVETTTEKYDVGQAVINELRPNTKVMNIEYSIEPDPHLETLESQVHEGNEKAWALYSENPDNFWDKSISLFSDSARKKDFKKVKTFRTKLLNSYKKKN